VVENVAIQPPTLGDAYAAAALHYQSWVATYTRLLAPDQAARLTLEERAGHWERLLRERPPDRGALVAKRGSTLVGLVEWELGPRRDPTVGEVHAIHVAPEERGRGSSTPAGPGVSSTTRSSSPWARWRAGAWTPASWATNPSGPRRARRSLTSWSAITAG